LKGKINVLEIVRQRVPGCRTRVTCIMAVKWLVVCQVVVSILQ